MSSGNKQLDCFRICFFHLVIEVVERRFIFREMAEKAFRKVAYPQLIPENDRDGVRERKRV